MQRRDVRCIHHADEGWSCAERRLTSLSRSTRALDEFLQRQEAGGRLARLREGRGLWSQRNDLPDWDALRRELDR